MEKLKEKGDEFYNKQFSQWDKCLKDNGCESVEDLMEKVFGAIKADKFEKQEKKKSYSPKFLNENKTLV